MSMNETPSGDRVHIGIFGNRNAGKSSLINALTGQNIAVVSAVPGTTTDPVSKTMELLPLGPVVLTDTPGMDDAGALGGLRVGKARQVMHRTDIALLVADGTVGMTENDRMIEAELQRLGIPYLTVFSKSDKAPGPGFRVSAATGENIRELKEKLAAMKPEETAGPLVRDLVHAGDTVVLVVPIDDSAPKGRLILPQQQVIRELLDCEAAAVVTRETQLAETLKKLQTPPRMVITDSQAFPFVNRIVPPEIPLTSFSILFARSKGDLEQTAAGAQVLGTLQTGDRVLISEGCTHHRQCNDIGTVKLPGRIRKFCGAEPVFEFTSGTDFPADLSPYRLVIHCGGCMLNVREMRYRYRQAAGQQVPMTNYGIAIAAMHGILKRATALFQTAEWEAECCRAPKKIKKNQ